MIAVDTNVLVKILVHNPDARINEVPLHTFDLKRGKLEGDVAVR